MKVFREPWTWIVALMLVLLATLAWAQPYQLTDLGANFTAYGINDKGEISGVDPSGNSMVHRGGQWTLQPPCWGSVLI